MRNLAYTLVLTFMSFPVFASHGDLGAKAALRGGTSAPGVICSTCDDGGGGGGSGGGGGTTTPEKMTYFEVDPTSNTIEMRTSRGVVIVIDEPLNKMYLETAQFHSEKNLSDVLLQKAGGNITAANVMRAQLRDALADAKRAAKLVPSSSGGTGFTTGNQFLSRSLRRHAEGGQGQGLMMGGGGTYWGCYYDIYGCYVRPVSDFSGGGGGWGNYDFGFYTDLPAGGGGTTSDYNLWRMWVDSQCDSAASNALATVAGILMMAESCEFSMTGVGAWVCYTGYVTASVASTNFSENAANCYSDYPGPNNWGL